MNNNTQNNSAQSDAPRSFLVRFLCAYLFLYAFPFPLSALISVPLTLLAQLLSPFGVDLAMLSQFGDMMYHLSDMLFGLFTVPLGNMLGLKVSLTPTGSGDTTHHLLKLVVVLFASLFIALTWTWKRKSQNSVTQAKWLHVWGRWWLATIMMYYGCIKLFGQQFWVANAHEQVAALGDHSPMHLAWVFLGHSPGYQAFAGLAELIPAILILHRRTAMVGLMLIFGVLCNVFALNLFFDIPVKMASGHYLLASLLLLLPYKARIIAFAKGDAQLPSPELYIKTNRFSETAWKKVTLAAGTALVVSTFAGTKLKAQQMEKMRKPTPLAGRWDVQSTLRDDTAWTDTKSYQSMAIDNIGRLSLFSFEGEKTSFGLEASERADILTLRYPFRRQKELKPTREQWTVKLDETTVQGPNNKPTGMHDRLSTIPVRATRITLNGHWKGQEYQIVAVRRPLPIQQPFRWIQEAPFQH